MWVQAGWRSRSEPGLERKRLMIHLIIRTTTTSGSPIQSSMLCKTSWSGITDSTTIWWTRTSCSKLSAGGTWQSLFLFWSSCQWLSSGHSGQPLTKTTQQSANCRRARGDHRLTVRYRQVRWTKSMKRNSRRERLRGNAFTGTSLEAQNTRFCSLLSSARASKLYWCPLSLYSGLTWLDFVSLLGFTWCYSLTSAILMGSYHLNSTYSSEDQIGSSSHAVQSSFTR